MVSKTMSSTSILPSSLDALDNLDGFFGGVHSNEFPRPFAKLSYTQASVSKDGLVQKEMLVQCHYDECSSSASGDQKNFCTTQGLVGYTIVIIIMMMKKRDSNKMIIASMQHKIAEHNNQSITMNQIIISYIITHQPKIIINKLKRSNKVSIIQ